MAVRFNADGEGYAGTTGLPDTTYTCTWWAYISADRDYYSTFISLDSASGYMQVATEVNGTTLKVWGEPGSDIVGGALTVGTWYAMALVRNGANATLYWGTNPAALSSATAASVSAATPTHFRVAGYRSTGEWMDGRIAAVKLWDSVLTQTQISAELQSYDPVITASLIRVHKLRVPETTDYSGNGHTLTGGTGATTEADPPITTGTTYSKAGGAARLSASSGAKSVVAANFINKAGGGASVRAGSGAKVLANIPPDLLPSDVLDLSYWHLTTPEDEGDGTAEQINQPALDSYETSNFFADTVGGKPCVVFQAPVDGFSTSAASGATRMELRQHRKSGYANAAMDPNGSGRWQMTITTSADPTSITGGSNPRQELIIAQIHGAGDSPIPLILSAEWTSSGSPVTPRVRVFKNGPAVPTHLISNITTSTRLTFRIRLDADAGRLKVWGVAGEVTDLPPITAATTFDWPISDFTDQEGWYFKGGAYHKTTITSGSSGMGIAKVTYLNVLEPGDPEEVFSVVYERTGGAASLRAGSGAKTLAPATVHAKTGGAARASAGSGTRTLVPATVHARTGGAAARGASSGASATTSATTYSRAGGAAGRGAGAGARQFVRSETGGGAVAGAGTGARTRDLPRDGGAAAGSAGTGELAVSHTYVLTGGAATSAAGSGSADIASIMKTGGASAAAAGSGALQTGGGIEHARTGGASTSAAGTGSLETQAATVYVLTGGASTSVAGSGTGDVQPAVVHTRTGGASASAASTGLAQHVPAVRHDRTGGAAAVAVGSGTGDVAASVVHVKAGGSAVLGAGTGAVSVTGATVHVRTGGAASRGSGIGLVEVIGPAVHEQTGGSVAVLAGSGRGRVGGRLHAAVPVAIGQFRSGTPVRR